MTTRNDEGTVTSGKIIRIIQMTTIFIINRLNYTDYRYHCT
jgi:hypothetical protein